LIFISQQERAFLKLLANAGINNHQLNFWTHLQKQQYKEDISKWNKIHCSILVYQFEWTDQKQKFTNTNFDTKASPIWV